MESDLTVLFTGNVTHKLDPKSRLAIPAGWRSAQGVELTILEASSDGFPILKCFTREAFAEKISGIRKQGEARGVAPGEIDRYIGFIAGRCFPAEVSSQGKLLIPKAQRENLKLTDMATIVGRGPHFEIWEPENFKVANSPASVAELDKMFNMIS